MNGLRDVLVIEDSRSDFRLIERHLKQKFDAHCHRVASLEELRAALDSKTWDMVLSDYNVPGLDFLDSLRTVKAHSSNLPLILISGNVGEERAVELLKLGVSDFVLKDNLIRLETTIQRSLQDAAERVARQEAESRYGSLFENMLDAYAYCRIFYDEHGKAQDFEYLEVNAAFARLTGLNDVVGRKISEIIPGIADSAPQLFEVYGRVALTGRAERFETYIEPLQSWFAISVYSPRSECFVAIFDNITERIRAEEAQRRAQKLEAMGQLTGGIAHDFANILGIISANLQLIEHRPNKANVAEGVRLSLSAAERGAKLIRRLLAFSRRQSEEIRGCEVGEELEKIRGLVAEFLPKNVTFRVSVADGLWPARMDPSEFGDAILNLAINAVQAMPDGGVLHIEAFNVTIDHPSKDLPNGGWVMVAIGDNGIGIPAPLLDRVFEPFFTTKERSGGSGLGLPMVYGFAQRCGGAVRIYSEAGHGTTVRLYLPRHAGPATEAKSDAAPAPARGRGEMVLIVEDEPGILSAAERYLLDLGYRTVTAPGPDEAWQLVASDLALALLFTDISMPGPINGLELALRAQAIRPDLKVVLTTGFTEASPAFDAASRRFPVLPKPYGLAELANTLRAALDG